MTEKKGAAPRMKCDWCSLQQRIYTAEARIAEMKAAHYEELLKMAREHLDETEGLSARIKELEEGLRELVEASDRFPHSDMGGQRDDGAWQGWQQLTHDGWVAITMRLRRAQKSAHALLSERDDEFGNTPTSRLLPNSEDDFGKGTPDVWSRRQDVPPRRNRLDLNTPAELAIRAAVDAVEVVGAHPLLTEAVILLGQAREKVADYVDRCERDEKSGTNSLRVSTERDMEKGGAPVHQTSCEVWRLDHGYDACICERSENVKGGAPE